MSLNTTAGGLQTQTFLSGNIVYKSHKSCVDLGLPSRHDLGGVVYRSTSNKALDKKSKNYLKMLMTAVSPFHEGESDLMRLFHHCSLCRTRCYFIILHLSSRRDDLIASRLLFYYGCSKSDYEERH